MAEVNVLNEVEGVGVFSTGTTVPAEISSSIRPISFASLVKVAAIVFFAVAIIVVFAYTSVGSRVVSKLGIAANAAEASLSGDSSEKSGNILTAFLSRSPGERGATDAIKGKAKVNATDVATVAATTKPQQRALGKVFENPTSKSTGEVMPQPILDFLPDNIVSETDPVLALALPTFGGSGLFSPIAGGGIGGGGGFIGGGGSGGGIGGGGNVINPPPAPDVASAVPEPSTWLFLLIGFAFIGASLRRSKIVKPILVERVGICVAS